MASNRGQDPGTSARRHDWRTAAACRGEDPDLFFSREFEIIARKICITCPVRPECLASILDIERGTSVDYRDGIVAGLTPRERWRLGRPVPDEDEEPSAQAAEEPACGTHDAMIQHLGRGEPLDSECWSGLQRRERSNKVKRGETRPKKAQARTLTTLPGAKRRGSAKPAVRHAPKPVGVHPPTGATVKERHVYRLWSQGLPDVEIARCADLSTLAVRRVRDAYGLIANTPAAKAS
ncbi:WhiB family transcriptional regulator [Streptomyces sp. NPDC058202]|uniref:WhiB family transcriptional regulator n=1 Tax=Streptomyces sp. NPDC058202 TaxID=3346380 RepID=UPI0036E55BDE